MFSTVTDTGAGLDWSQTLILGAAILLGLGLNALRRKRNSRRSQTEEHGGRGQSAANRSGIAWQRSVGVLRGSAASAATAQSLSPGEAGPNATRDLSRGEIRGLRLSYAPHLDGDPDPGEIVWTWVPYAENDGRGKDRPVLIIARIDDRTVGGCYLSTKEHRGFIAVGTGGWDPQGRESFLAPDRILRIDADGMRREGQVLPLGRFEQAAEAVARLHGIAH